GLADLAGHRLASVRDENLLADPLRALRAARFIASLGLVPDRSTFAAARASAPGLARVAVERVSAELERLLASPRAAPALAWASRAKLLPATLGVPLPAANETAVLRALRALDDPATRRLPAERRGRLRMTFIAIVLGMDAARARRWLAER